MQYVKAGDFGYPADNSVPVNITRFSRPWQERQFEAVCQNFSHVIVEANRALFGTLFDADVESEIRALQARGVKVAAASHGSDLRLPSRHQKIDQWSPFNEPAWALIPSLEEKALLTRRVLSATGIPVFVPTPELLLDWPEAQWLPIVVDVERWSRDDAVLREPRLRIVHAPSKDVVKGTHLIEESMRRLQDEGVVEYRVVRGVPAAEMPRVYGDADIVIDQFRIGTYATGAIEAMAAGRIVIAHLHDQVRAHVRENFSLEIPIVEAMPDSIEATIRDIAANRGHYLPFASAGPEFARALHDGEVSSHVLATFLD
ncbi:glycosyltransferase [Rhodoglobus vestalii]|nr:glycosyltransferase [Rhodoglobus vestalii]